MRFSDAKSVSIADYLAHKGLKPVRIIYGSAWFYSPLRKEKTPSFKVNLHKNLWYDFGEGEGGNIIDLVQRIDRTEDLDVLGHLERNNILSCNLIKENPAEPGKIVIRTISELVSPSLYRYLNSRKISFSMARKFLKEAHYSVHGRNYFALAFANDKGGFELRNNSYKSGASPKFFTTIHGEDPYVLNVFEGFMDFLSCCSYYNRVPKAATIILNSLSFLTRIETQIQKAKRINLFLDNDNAGRAAARKVISMGGNIIDWSQILYPDHKDFNDFLKG